MGKRNFKSLRRAENEQLLPVGKSSVAIEQVIAQFLQAGGIQLGDTPAMATNRCFEVALAFTWFAMGMGEDAIMLRCCGLMQPPTNPLAPRPGPDSHWMTWFVTDERGVDFTARQFWPEKPHPWILSKHMIGNHFNWVQWKRTEIKHGG